MVFEVDVVLLLVDNVELLLEVLLVLVVLVFRSSSSRVRFKVVVLVVFVLVLDPEVVDSVVLLLDVVVLDVVVVARSPSPEPLHRPRCSDGSSRHRSSGPQCAHMQFEPQLSLSIASESGATSTWQSGYQNRQELSATLLHRVPSGGATSPEVSGSLAPGEEPPSFPAADELEDRSVDVSGEVDVSPPPPPLPSPGPSEVVSFRTHSPPLESGSK